MGYIDVHYRARLADPMNLLHGSNGIVQMLDHIARINSAELIRFEGPWSLIEVVHDIWMGSVRQVNVDSLRHPL